MARGEMLTLAVLYLLGAWTLTVDSKMVQPLRRLCLNSSETIELNMVPNSVDDRYSGCTERMLCEVKNKYLQEENQGVFKKAWNGAKRCAKKHLNNDDGLTQDHVRAICAYTGEKDAIYPLFNEKVRTSKGVSFKFNALHFLLTDAIHLLKLKQKEKCLTTYRRTKMEFEGKVNDKIRFGFFASSSFNRNMNEQTFGRKTCFVIRTCFGAYLKSYPTMGDREKEVLIPPYETFKIRPNKKESTELDCKVVYTLKSIGPVSNLNCRLFKHN